MKEYWVTNSRFRVILLVLVFIWIGLMTFLYLKANEITHDPCSVCSKKMGEEILCTTQSYQPITRTYYPNYSIKDKGF